MDDLETQNRRVRLKELLDTHFPGVGGQRELLDYIEARTKKRPSQGELSLLLKEKSFGIKKGIALSEQIGLSRKWFELPPGTNLKKEEWLNETVEPAVKKDFYSVAVPEKEYPRVIGTAQMGDKGYYLDLDGGDGYLEIEAASGSIAIRVRGDSMFPAIRDGWFIVIEPDTMPAVGEYVLLKMNDGKKMVKELLQVKDDCYIVMSVNGGERITAMKIDVENICAVSAIVPPSKHKEKF